MASQGSDSSISIESSRGIATLTLDSPTPRNALTLPMARQLIAACDAIDADDEIGAVIIDGGPSFCSGADRQLLGAVAEDRYDGELIRDLRTIYDSFIPVGNLLAPIVAAIRGAAVGAGVNLAASADLRIVSRDRRVIVGFQRIGVHPEGCHFALLARSLGYKTAAALTVFGQELDAAGRGSGFWLGCRASRRGTGDRDVPRRGGRERRRFVEVGGQEGAPSRAPQPCRGRQP